MLLEYKRLATFLAHDESTHQAVLQGHKTHMEEAFEKGLQFWLEMTKGQQKMFCEIQSSSLAFALFNAMDTYLRYCVQSEHMKREHRVAIEDIMQNTLGLFLAPRSISYYSASISQNAACFDARCEILMANFVVMDPAVILPISKYQDLQLAFCMGLHRKLGDASPIQCLSRDIARSIWQIFDQLNH